MELDTLRQTSPPSSCRSWILRPFCRACVDFVRFRYARSVPPLLFRLVLRFACVLLCVVCVLSRLFAVFRGNSVKLDKIYGFSFFARLRAYFGLVWFWLPFGLAVRPSGRGAPVPIKQKQPYPLYYPTYLQIKIFLLYMGKI